MVIGIHYQIAVAIASPDHERLVAEAAAAAASSEYCQQERHKSHS
jgi:hypothetical protein